MEVDTDEEYEHLSEIDSEAEDDFAEARNETPGSTPPALTPTSALLPCRTKRFHCSWEGCDKSFIRQSRLGEHIRSHTNERPFICPYPSCSNAYLRDSHLKAHIKSAHDKIRDYKCKWEGCEKSFSTGQRLRTHIKTHEGQEKYKCRGYLGCNETFRKKETLRRHVMAAHEKTKPFPCTEQDSVTAEKCTKAFDTAQKLRRHIKTNHDQTRFSCTECLADNAATVALASEEHPPTLKKAYFATMLEFQAHNAEFHPPICPHCQTPFETQRQLASHIELAHDIKPTRNNKKEYKCTYPGCGLSYSKQGNLNVHVQQVHEKTRKFICGQTQISLPEDEVPPGTVVAGCGQNFSSKQVLADHVRIAHLGLPSLQSQRKRKAAESDERIAKRARKDNSVGKSKSVHVVYTTPGTAKASEFSGQTDSPDFFNGDDDGDVDSLTGSMVMFGSQIFHRDSTYHYPSGQYPSPSNSIDMGHNPYQPATNHLGNEFCDDNDNLQVAGTEPSIDPRLFTIAATTET